MDTIITNSENVQSRIQKYLGIDSRVIYPPCETEKFKWLGQEDFYLSTARLDPLKRVDLVVKAFLDMPEKKLKVISGGPDMPKIKKLAQGAENIQVLGWVDERMLVELLGRCVATIYIPRDEDFGMAPIESMAAGKPVIGVAEGGLLETVVDGKTGILIKADPSPEDVIQAVQAVQKMPPERSKDMREACERRAKLFDKDVFVNKIQEVFAG
jgi:glycosyltransferase involved in cell wall biosynthesis